MTEPHSAVLVLVSADAEWAPVVEALRPERLERCPYGNFFVQSVGGTPILFLHGGWGKIAAAASTEYAISRWQPQVLMNLGTCGGIRGRAQRGEKLLVMRAITYDIQESMGSAEAAILARTTEIDLTWLDDEFPVPVRRTHIVSGDRDLVPSEVTGLVRDFDAVAGDWESSAIAYVAARRGVPLLIIRAVSDLVDEVVGETIGALPVFTEAAAAQMRSLLADLESRIRTSWIDCAKLTRAVSDTAAPLEVLVIDSPNVPRRTDNKVGQSGPCHKPVTRLRHCIRRRLR